MDRPGPPVDRARLRAAVRRMGKDHAYLMLDDAIELLPQADLRRIIAPYVDVETLRADDGGPPEGSPIASVEAFARASLAGEYYEPFEVNSRNHTLRSAGTLSWIAECRRLFDGCARVARSAAPADVRKAFGTLFDLLDRIDECGDDIVFFADEGGSWQVGIDWEAVLPPWFAVLSATAEPEEFACLAVERVRRHCAYRAGELLETAGACATPDQRAAMERIANTRGAGRMPR